MTGILSANAEYPSFESVMSELESIARRPVKLSETDETNLPQVHAMNSMKEIFKSSALSKKSELHVAAGLQLAAESLQSDMYVYQDHPEYSYLIFGEVTNSYLAGLFVIVA